MKKLFIDGESGTTGLQIREKLKTRTDIELLSLPKERRRHLEDRVKLAKQADCLILCLPDEAAKEIVDALKGHSVKIIDASTTHRIDPNWTYGFPELRPDYREKIKTSNRVTNPGCYATGFIALVRPLIDKALLPADFSFTINAVSGYSGGGRSLIKIYEKERYRYMPYALGLEHKHVPEMKKIAGLSIEPLFIPAVDAFYQGMLIQVPLHLNELKQNGIDLDAIKQCYEHYYANEPFVSILAWNETELHEGAFLPVKNEKNHNRLELILMGSHKGHLVLAARLDNLGKGASGAAIQNMNLMLGLDETLSLV